MQYSSLFDAYQLDESRGRITRECYKLEREREDLRMVGRRNKKRREVGIMRSGTRLQFCAKERWGMVAEEGSEPGDGIAGRV